MTWRRHSGRRKKWLTDDNAPPERRSPSWLPVFAPSKSEIARQTPSFEIAAPLAELPRVSFAGHWLYNPSHGQQNDCPRTSRNRGALTNRWRHYRPLPEL